MTTYPTPAKTSCFLNFCMFFIPSYQGHFGELAHQMTLGLREFHAEPVQILSGTKGSWPPVTLVLEERQPNVFLSLVAKNSN
jgi:hypothetical protein